jgi:tRNA-dihydrouridine synthase
MILGRSTQRNTHQPSFVAREMFDSSPAVICLAPMVRASSLPFRSLAMKYGADYVYSEEIIDKRMMKASRLWNEKLQTIDYVIASENVIIFRTVPQEKPKLIVQLGTASAETALQAALVIQSDVAGIDINMGCPKVPFPFFHQRVFLISSSEIQYARRDGGSTSQ